MPTTRTPTLTPATTPASALARALEPLTAEEFLAEIWERRPLHVPRAVPGRFDDLFSAEDAERLICDGGLRLPGFRLVKAGERLHPSTYTTDLSWRPSAFTGVAEVDRVLAEFEGGATIVLQGLHLSWTPLARFCRRLEAELGHPVQTNAYLTPRCSQGLPVHHDTHDVLVLQVSGRKRWLVYEPALELPLRDQRYSPELGGPGETVLDVELAPGDTLYLPRGWLHEAVTSEEDSLHLTIGVNVPTRLDALRAALERCAEDVEFRRGLTADGGLPVDGLLERLAARLEPEEVRGTMRSRFLGGRRPIHDGQLTQLRALDELEAETLVERRQTVIAELVSNGDGTVGLAFEGKRVLLPGGARAALELAVSADEPFRPADLPGLDAASRLVLVRRLVREGFLRVVSP